MDSRSDRKRRDLTAAAAVGLLVTLFTLPAFAGFKDGVFTSAEHGVKFKLPKDWKLETVKGDDGRFAMFQNADGSLRGGFLHVREGWTAAKHAKWRGAEWVKKSKTVTWDSEEKLAGGDREKVVFALEQADGDFKATHLFVANGKDNFELILRCPDAQADEAAKIFDAVVASVELGEFKEEPGGDEAGADKEVLLPNPWEGCGKGSWVKYAMTSEAAGTRTEMEMVMTLVDFDGDSYTQKTDMVMNGAKIPGQDQKVSRLQKAPESGEAPKPEEGDETVKVAKGEYKCHWVKTKSDQGWSQIWTSDDVVLKTVKTVAEFGGGKSSMELVDFEKK